MRAVEACKIAVFWTFARGFGLLSSKDPNRRYPPKTSSAPNVEILHAAHFGSLDS